MPANSLSSYRSGSTSLKDNIPWVPHDTDMGEHPKCEALIAAYGFEGYGRFQRLNELIGRADGCRLDLGRKLYFNQVAGKLRMSPDELRVFINFLADPDECGLLRCEGDVLWTDRTQEALEKTRKTREDGRDRQRRRRSTEQPPDNDEQPESNAEVTRDEGTEQSRAEQTRNAAAADSEFHAWLKRWAEHNPKIRNAPAFVRKALQDPGEISDLIDEYLEEIANRPPPAPEVCPKCGSTDLDVGPGLVECLSCGHGQVLSRGKWVDRVLDRAPPPARPPRFIVDVQERNGVAT